MAVKYSEVLTKVSMEIDKTQKVRILTTYIAYCQCVECKWLVVEAHCYVMQNNFYHRKTTIKKCLDPSSQNVCVCVCVCVNCIIKQMNIFRSKLSKIQPRLKQSCFSYFHSSTQTIARTLLSVITCLL